jgi:hypothetical protein
VDVYRWLDTHGEVGEVFELAYIDGNTLVEILQDVYQPGGRYTGATARASSFWRPPRTSNRIKPQGLPYLP